MFSNISLNEFRLNTLEGYAEGGQAGAGPLGGSLFFSYEGEYKTIKNKGDWFSRKVFQKGKLLYRGYSYGVGVGPEYLSVSGSRFSGNTIYLGEVTNYFNEDGKK